MKKIIIALLLTLFCLTSFALAETSPVVQNGALAAYHDGDGKLYIPGKADAINTAPVSALVSIDPYRVLFYSKNASGSNDLYAIGLTDFNETCVAVDVHAAIMSDDDTLFYVTNAERTQLVRVDMNTHKSDVAYTAVEPIDRLYRCAEGLVFGLVDNAGTMQYISQTGAFRLYFGEKPASGYLTDTYEVYLSEDGTLFKRDLTSLMAEQIDANVADYAQIDDEIYYIVEGDKTVLKSFNTQTMVWNVVTMLGDTMEKQLTASAEALFMIDQSGTVYTLDTATGELKSFAKYADLSGISVPDGFEIAGRRIAAMDGQLNVYVELKEKDEQPAFSFIEFTETSDALEPVYKLLDTVVLENETNTEVYLTPVAQYMPLIRGSRGDAVRAIQQPLYDLGYYDYYVDGIFGPRTQLAVEMLQEDLGLPVTGVADAALQRTILGGKLSKYDPYKPLTRGNKGRRVRKMQEYLRALGYLADAADGIFGGNTQTAVRLFQYEHGLNVQDNATKDTLKLLYSGRAHLCASYIDLYPGNTGIRVRELNDRLRELYYLPNICGSVYTEDTVRAVTAFQRRMGMTANGNATVPVLKALFADNAPEASGYITLRRGDDNDRVLALQRRLRQLGYYEGPLDGYFGKQTERAVALFQRKVDIEDSGIATVYTQKLLFAKDAPVYVKPTVIGTPSIRVDNYYHREGDIYYVTDDSAQSGYVTVKWSVEGEADYFNVKVIDPNGKKLLDEDTLMVRTGVAIGTLKFDEPYTLTVTAYPADGNKKHITKASIEIIRYEEPDDPQPAYVGEPEISLYAIEETVDDVNYMKSGTIDVYWYAEGDVNAYKVEVFDGTKNILNITTTDKQLSIKTDTLAPDKIYTVTVYAIPVDGTIDDATMNCDYFALYVPGPGEDDELPGKPEIRIDAVAGYEGDVALLSGDRAAFKWSATGDISGYDVEIASAEGSTVYSDTTDKEKLDFELSGLSEDLIYTLSVAAFDVNDRRGEPASVRFALASVEEVPTEDAEPTPVDEAAEAIEIELSVTPEVGRDGDITLVAGNVIALNWHADGDANTYEVAVLDSTDRVMASATTQLEQFTVETSRMSTEEVYTLRVTVNGATASIRFAPVVETEEEIVDDVSEAPAYEPEDVEPPVIGFSPAVGTDDDVTLVSGNMIELSWYAENAGRYAVEIVNGSGNTMASTKTPGEGLMIESARMVPGEVYTLKVTAMATGATASAKFALEDSAGGIPEVIDVLEEVDEDESYYKEPAEEAVPEYIEDIDETADSVFDYEEEEETGYEEPVYEEAEYEDEEPAYEEPAYEEYAEPVYEEYDEPAYEEYDEPEYNYEEEDLPDPVEQAQRLLVELGFLEGKYKVGKLDDATIDALYAFVDDYNELTGAGLYFNGKSVGEDILFALNNY